MKLAVYIAAVMLLVGCKKFDRQSFDNLNNGKVDVIGHGGVGFESETQPLPSNSLASIRKALEGLGADGVEVDVQMTIDSALVLYHDEYLDSKTGCHGCIPEYKLNDVNACEYTIGPSNETLRIYTLKGLLTQYSTLDEPPIIYLDMRLSNACDNYSLVDLDVMARELREVMVWYNAFDFVRVESGSKAFLEKLIALDSRFQLYLDANNMQDALAIAEPLGLRGVVLNNQLVSADDVEQAHNAGIEVILFNVKSASSTRDALEKSPDGIQTDVIEIMQSMLE